MQALWFLLLFNLANAETHRFGIDDPKYAIEFHSAESPYVPEEPDMETVLMTKKNLGNLEKFECFLPKKLERTSNDSNTGVTLAVDPQDTRKSPEELLEVLRGNCFFRHEGWWTYEICFSPIGHVRQLHVEPGQKIEAAQAFVLGNFDAEATARLHETSPVLVQKDPRSQTAAQKYYAHMYTNGTRCDLTNEPRQTEVRFVCSLAGGPLISSIKEAPSCKYTLIFQAPMLCRHPLYKEEQQPWLTINCNAVAGTSQEEETIDEAFKQVSVDDEVREQSDEDEQTSKQTSKQISVDEVSEQSDEQTPTLEQTTSESAVTPTDPAEVEDV